MKILISGGKGFIGTPIEKLLTERGHVVSYYDLADGNDVLDYGNYEAAIYKVDAVIHLAGILGTSKTIVSEDLCRRCLEVNIMGGWNAIEACLQHKKRLILLDNGNFPAESPYPASKTCINTVAMAYAHHRQLNCDIVRAFNVYGEDQSIKQEKFAPTWITQALQGKPLTIYGDGTQILDPIYVQDVAQIIVDVLLNEKGNGNIFEAGTGKGWTARDFARLINKLAESDGGLMYEPMHPGEEEGAVVVAVKPYMSEFSDLEKTLKSTIEFYKNQNG